MQQRQLPVQVPLSKQQGQPVPKQQAEIAMPDDDEILGLSVKQMQQEMQRGNIAVMEDLGSESGSEDIDVGRANTVRRTKRGSRASVSNNPQSVLAY
jgi:hypothetical protein